MKMVVDEAGSPHAACLLHHTTEETPFEDASRKCLDGEEEAEGHIVNPFSLHARMVGCAVGGSRVGDKSTVRRLCGDTRSNVFFFRERERGCALLGTTFQWRIAETESGSGWGK